MQARSSLSIQQINEIFRAYLHQPETIDQVIQRHLDSNTNLIKSTVLTSLLEHIRLLLLQLERHLCLREQIKSMPIYEHDSSTIYKPILMNLKKIVPPSSQGQLMIMYKNIFVRPIDTVIKMQAYIRSEKKLQIYEAIIKFVENEDLFTKVRLQQKDPTAAILPFQNISKIFPARDMELIYRLFIKSEMKPLVTYQNLKSLGVKGEEYQNQVEFIARLDNLLLIGLYKCYKEICKKNEIEVDQWKEFIVKKYKNINFEPYLQLLLRIAIRSDGSEEQISIIYHLIQKKMVPKIQKSALNCQNVSSEKKQEEKRTVFQQRLWGQMQKIVKQKKIEKKRNNRAAKNAKNVQYPQMVL